MENDLKHSLFSLDKQKRSKGDSRQKEIQLSRESAIKSENVSIIALSGLDAELSEYNDGGRECWEFEPLPGFERLIAGDNVDGIRTFEVGIGGKNKLWGYLCETAGNCFDSAGKKINLDLLTPYQAASLVGKTIKEHVNYENLLNDLAVEEMIEADQIYKTLRPDLLSLYIKNPRKFYTEVEKLNDEIDKMRAEQLMEQGFGVCRHIAAEAAVLYQLLKEKQQGVLLNGTYMIYHGENVGDQALSSVVGRHSYNILLVTSPTGELKLSVVDPTWMMDREGDMDYTWERISQGCAFLSEYGDYFEIDDVESTVSDLAEQASLRLIKYFAKLPLYSHGDSQSIYNFLNDYVSLLNQSVIGKTGRTIKHLISLYESNGYSRERMLTDLLDLPSYIYKSYDETIIRDERLGELNLEFRKVDFTQKEGLTDLLILHETLGNTLGNYSLKWLRKLDEGRLNLNTSYREGLELIGHYVCACIGLNIFPNSPRQVEVVQHALYVARKFNVKGDLLTLGGNYLTPVKHKKRR